jgi:hypothetical protein
LLFTICTFAGKNVVGVESHRGLIGKTQGTRPGIRYNNIKMNLEEIVEMGVGFD